MRIAVIASEVRPFAVTGGLADVIGSLPGVWAKAGHRVVVVVPGYRCVRDSGMTIRSVPGEFPVKVGERVLLCRLSRKRHLGVEHLFLENPELFDRDGLYGTSDGDFPDNLERFSFMARAGLEALAARGFAPDVISCHDWQTGLVPAYRRELFGTHPLLGRARTVFTIHNLGYQGRFPGDRFVRLGLPAHYLSIAGLEYYGDINLLKAGLVTSELITTVSPTYAREIRTGGFGMGLDGVLRQREPDLHGILNGIDYRSWDPGRDEALTRNYSASDPGPRRENRQALARELGLARPDAPLFGMVARLSRQKGLGLVGAVVPDLVEAGANLVILGTGEPEYHRILTGLAERHAGQVSVNLRFDDRLARRIYGGADVFLMPSEYEPCGLGQLIAFRYGAVPIGFRTGGLADTIIDVAADPARGNGFLFGEFTPAAFRARIRHALELLRNETAWGELVRRGMSADFSWGGSAQRYVELFETLLGRPQTWPGPVGESAPATGPVARAGLKSPGQALD
jgi:starch synthase